jgi:hypothetical protein
MAEATTIIRAFGIGTRQAFVCLSWAPDLRPRWLPWFRLLGGRWANAGDVSFRWLWLWSSLTVEKPGTRQHSWLSLNGRRWGGHG